MSLLVPNERLEKALSAYKPPYPAHTGGSSALPFPNIYIESLQTALNLPLQPSQARQLLSLSATQTQEVSIVNDSHELEPKDFWFNPSWSSTLQAFADSSVRDLGIEPDAVKHRLYKLLVAKAGGRFCFDKNTECHPGVFARLLIQLPSCFRGGRLVSRNLGDEYVYTNGADDKSCSEKIYFTAFLSDVQYELTTLTKGYCIALVYDICWKGDPWSALPDASLLTPVIVALREVIKHTTYGADDSQAWMLRIPLKTEYSIASLQTYGIHALKNRDSENIDVIRRASESIKSGELEVVVCLLERNGQEYYSEDDIAEDRRGKCRISTVYNADGSVSDHDLDFVNLSKITARGKFVLEHRSRPQRSGDTFVCDVLHKLTIAVMWPKQKQLEILSRSVQNLKRILEAVPDTERKSAIGRTLEWHRREENYRMSSITLEKAILFMSCSQDISESQAENALYLVRHHIDDTRVRKGAVALISRFGWIRYASWVEKELLQVSDFWCSYTCKIPRNLEGPLKLFCTLGNIVPSATRVKVLDSTLKYLLEERTVFERVPYNSSSEHLRKWEAEKKKVLELSVEVLDATLTARTEVADEDKPKLDALLNHMYRTWMKSKEGYLTSMTEFIKGWEFNSNDTGQIEDIKRKLESRARDEQVEKFMEECRRVVKELKPPHHSFEAYESYYERERVGFHLGSGCFHRRGPGGSHPRSPEDFYSPIPCSVSSSSFKSFIGLAFRVMSRETIPSEVSTLYKKFVSIIPNLSPMSITSIANSVEELQRVNKCELPYIHQTVMYFKDQNDLNSLKNEEHRKVMATTYEPSDVRRVYADIM